MFVSKYWRLAIALAVCGLTALPARGASAAITWYNSTNYTLAFGTNSVTNLVSVAVEYPGFGGLRDDGGIAETHPYYAQHQPAGLTNIVALASSSWYLDEPFTLALRSDGTVFQWGLSQVTSVPPAGLSNVIAVTAGMWHSAALKADGTVAGWGFNNYGATNIPAGLSNVVAISAGARHTLALKRDGTVVAWGSNDFQQTNVPAGLSNIVGIAGGKDHSLALTSDGRLMVWGNYRTVYSNIVAGVSNVAIIAAGWGDVAVRKDGTIAAWGDTYSSGPALQATPLIATNVVSISCGYRNAALLGEGPPRLPAHPVRMTVPYGVPLVLPAMPGGHRALETQWSLDGSSLAGGNFGTLFLPSVSFSNAGVYSAIVSNWFGTATNVYTIEVAPFLLTFPPKSQVAYGGGTVRFSVGAFGANLSFQWRFDGAELAGATNSQLTLTNVAPNQAGAYSVTVSNSAGTQTLSATLEVAGALRFISFPQSERALVGTSVVLSGTAQGVGPLFFQWRFNGAELPGETRASLTITNILLGQSGDYSLLVSNAFAMQESPNAFLEVLPLAITSQPSDVSTFRGDTVGFSVNAGGIQPINYQWRFNGTDLPGATGAALALTNLQFSQSGVYSVRLANALTNLVAEANLTVSQVANWNYPYSQMGNIPGLTNLVSVATGGYHNLALRRDGTVLVWGLPTGEGELSIPESATNVIAIAAGGNKNLVLRRDGTVVAWGSNVDGENNVPATATNVVAIASGDRTSLAVRADGTVVGWGATSVPAKATNVVAIAAGYIHALALRADGTVLAWDGNNYGQATVPASLSNVVAIAAGGYDSLALRDNGSIVNWGQSLGGLGRTADGITIAGLGVGFGTAYALKADGHILGLGGATGIPANLRQVTEIRVGYSQVLALIGEEPPLMRAASTEPRISAEGFQFSIPSACGRVYRLEYRDSLAETVWKALPLVAGNGGSLTLTDTGAQTGTQRFYRVRRW